MLIDMIELILHLNTRLNELMFGIKCDTILFVISFEPL